LGTVTDPAAAAIAGAKVTATEVNIQSVTSRETNPSGNYEFPYLRPGLYRVAVEMGGFKRSSREPGCRKGYTVRVDMKLQVGDVRRRL